MSQAAGKRVGPERSRGRLIGIGGSAGRGFTLAELITVVAIITLLLALALPSVRNFNLAGQFSQVRASLGTLTTTAMIPSYEQKSGLLVMRARPHAALEPGPDSSPDYDNPALGYQEVRVVTRAPYPDNPLDGYRPPGERISISREDFRQNPFYRTADRTEVTRLTELTWLAPDYATAMRVGGRDPELGDGQFANERLIDPYTEMFPAGGEGANQESLVNAFFVLFDEGECIREPAGNLGENLVYSLVNNRDRGYRGAPPNTTYNPQGMVMIDHESARGVYVYARGSLREIVRRSLSTTAEDRRNFLREQGRVLYCTRYGGNLIEGATGGQ